MSQHYTHTHSYSYPGFAYSMTPSLPPVAQPQPRPQPQPHATPGPEHTYPHGQGHTPSRSTPSSTALTTPPEVQTTLPLLQPMDLSRYFAAAETPSMVTSTLPTSHDRSQLSTPIPASRTSTLGHGHSHSYSYPGQPFAKLTESVELLVQNQGDTRDLPCFYPYQLGGGTMEDQWVDRRLYPNGDLTNISQGPLGGTTGGVAYPTFITSSDATVIRTEEVEGLLGLGMVKSGKILGGGVNGAGDGTSGETVDLSEWRQYGYAQPYLPWEGTGEEGEKEKEALRGRRHVCPVCEKRFNRPSSLNTHMSVHTGAKPYRCSHADCGRCFSVSSNLRRHMKTHETSKRTKDRSESAETVLDLATLSAASAGSARQQLAQPLCHSTTQVYTYPTPSIGGFGQNYSYTYSSTPDVDFLNPSTTASTASSNVTGNSGENSVSSISSASTAIGLAGLLDTPVPGSAVSGGSALGLDQYSIVGRRTSPKEENKSPSTSWVM